MELKLFMMRYLNDGVCNFYSVFSAGNNTIRINAKEAQTKYLDKIEIKQRIDTFSYDIRNLGYDNIKLCHEDHYIIDKDKSFVEKNSSGLIICIENTCESFISTEFLSFDYNEDTTQNSYNIFSSTCNEIGPIENKGNKRKLHVSSYIEFRDLPNEKSYYFNEKLNLKYSYKSISRNLKYQFYAGNIKVKEFLTREPSNTRTYAWDLSKCGIGTVDLYMILLHNDEVVATSDNFTITIKPFVIKSLTVKNSPYHYYDDLNISLMFDSPNLEVFNYQYFINDELKFQSTSSTNGGQNNLESAINRINLKNLKKGKNYLKATLSYLINDDFIEESISIEFIVETKPFEIFIDSLKPVYYHGSEGNNLSTIIYSDADKSKGSISYAVDNQVRLISREFNIKNHYQAFPFYLNTSQLDLGRHNIRCTAYSVNVALFSITKHFQVLPIFTFEFDGDNKYRYKTQRKLKGKYSINVIDNDSVTMLYRIYEANHEKIFKFSVHDDILEVDIPENLGIGTHEIKFDIISNTSFHKSYSFQFDIISNQPVITSVVTDKQVYFNDDTIITSISYQDFDADGVITLNYDFEGTIVNNTFALDGGEQIHEIGVTIPNDLKPGLHNISFWAQHLNDTSDKIIVNFTYAIFSIDIKLTKEKIKSSDSVLHANCSINYSLEDNISISFKFDNYNYHEYGNTTKFNEYQLLDIPIQKLSSGNHLITFKFEFLPYGKEITKGLGFSYVLRQTSSLNVYKLRGKYSNKRLTNNMYD